MIDASLFNEIQRVEDSSLSDTFWVEAYKCVGRERKREKKKGKNSDWSGTFSLLQTKWNTLAEWEFFFIPFYPQRTKIPTLPYQRHVQTRGPDRPTSTSFFFLVPRNFGNQNERSCRTLYAPHPSPTMTPAISYRTVCTGDALQTVEAHCKTPKEDEKGEALEFFGASMWCKM